LQVGNKLKKEKKGKEVKASFQFATTKSFLIFGWSNKVFAVL